MILVLFVSSIGMAFAQDVRFGLEVGANLSSLMGSASSSTNVSKLGIVGGGFLCFDLGNALALRPELLYEQKGVASSSANVWLEYDYIELPVLMKLSLGTPAVNPSILFGPAFSLNTSGQYYNSVASIPLKNMSALDVGIVGGLELDLDKFLISGRYELGLANVNSTGASIQNDTFTFLVGYSLM